MAKAKKKKLTFQESDLVTLTAHIAQLKGSYTLVFVYDGDLGED